MMRQVDAAGTPMDQQQLLHRLLSKEGPYLVGAQAAGELESIEPEGVAASTYRRQSRRAILAAAMAEMFRQIAHHRGGPIAFVDESGREDPLAKSLFELLRDPDPRVGQLVLSMLGGIAADLSPLAARRIVGECRRLFTNDVDDVLKSSAARLLHEITTESAGALATSIRILKRDRENPMILAYLTETIEIIVKREPGLLSQLEPGEAHELVGLLLRNIRKAPQSAGPDRDHPAWILRVHSLKVLARLGCVEPRVLELLKNIAGSDEDPEGQETAVWALSRLYVSPELLPRVDEFLGILVALQESRPERPRNILLENYAHRLLGRLCDLSQEMAFREAARSPLAPAPVYFAPAMIIFQPVGTADERLQTQTRWQAYQKFQDAGLPRPEESPRSALVSAWRREGPVFETGNFYVDRERASRTETGTLDLRPDYEALAEGVNRLAHRQTARIPVYDYYTLRAKHAKRVARIVKCPADGKPIVIVGGAEEFPLVQKALARRGLSVTLGVSPVPETAQAEGTAVPARQRIIVEGGRRDGAAINPEEKLALVKPKTRLFYRTKTMHRKLVHATGELHATAYVFLFGPDGWVLLQRRSPQNIVSGGVNGPTVTVHVNSEHLKFEDPVLAAVEDAFKKKLGIPCNASQLVSISRRNQIDRKTGNNHERTSVFFYAMSPEEWEAIKVNYNAIRIQRLELTPLEEFERAILADETDFSVGIRHIMRKCPELYIRMRELALRHRSSDASPPAGSSQSRGWIPSAAVPEAQSHSGLEGALPGSTEREKIRREHTARTVWWPLAQVLAHWIEPIQEKWTTIHVQNQRTWQYILASMSA